MALQAHFDSPDERILLSLLLHKLVFRSKEQVRSLLTQSLDKKIPQALYDITGRENAFKDISLLCSYTKTPTDFVIAPVIRDSDPPTKSGPLIARLFKRLANVNEKVMKWPWNLGEMKGIKTILFVDDFVGTGEQFLKFCDRHVDKAVFDKEINLLYCPMTAVEKGLEKIQQARPEIHLCPIEVVTPTTT